MVFIAVVNVSLVAYTLSYSLAPIVIGEYLFLTRPRGLASIAVNDCPLNLPRQVLKPTVNSLKAVRRYDFRFARPARSLDQIERTAWLSHHAISHFMSDAVRRIVIVEEKPDEQKRSDENHKRIAAAIAKANTSMQINDPGILLSRDENYQLSNRIAFAWKLASMGIPTTLIYLGFIGDENIAIDPHRLVVASDWQSAFNLHSAKHFPVALQSRPIDCGAASFWLLVRDLLVLNQSPKTNQMLERTIRGRRKQVR